MFRNFFALIFFAVLIFFSASAFAEETGGKIRINAEKLPVIHKLSRSDVVFRQFEETVFHNDRIFADELNTEPPAEEFYAYIPGRAEDILSVCAASGIPYDTLVTLNSLSVVSEKIAGKKIVLPTAKGVFVCENPVSFVEILISSESGSFVEKSEKTCYYLNGRKFYFLYGKRFTPAQRAFFLDTAMRAPLDHIRVTSGFGFRNSPVYKRWKSHNGIDFAAAEGTPVYACKSGKVAFVSRMDAVFGNYIVLSHEGGLSSVYAHLSEINVKKDSLVRGGDVIGLSGKTGAVTGPHLHFEVRLNGVAADPSDFINSGF